MVIEQLLGAGLTRRRFAQFLSGAAGLGLVDRLSAGLILGADTRRLSWRAHRTAGAEGSWVLDEIEGAIPTDLQGTLYRTAPGESERFGVTFRHLFDGDAYLSAWGFRDGKVALQARFLDQPGRLEEQEAGKMLYSEFGTQAPGATAPGGKNQPSVNIIPWDDMLLGLSEGGWPVAIDPDDLSYMEEWGFRGTLPRGCSFTAHPREDPSDGTYYAFGMLRGMAPQLVAWQMLKDGKVREVVRHPLPGNFMVHDMALTADHLVFVIPPVQVDGMALMRGGISIAEALRYGETEPTRVLVVPKSGEGEVQSFELPASMVFHHGNAFVSDGILMVDSLMSPDASVLKVLHAWSEDRIPEFQDNSLLRLSFDLESEEYLGSDELGVSQEFPRFDVRRTGDDARFLYTGGEPMAEDPFAFQALIRTDLSAGSEERRRVGKDQTVAEPVFVPRPGGTEEDDGYLLQLGYDGTKDRTFLDVVDAGSLEAAARIWAPTHLPLGFHGNWHPA